MRCARPVGTPNASTRKLESMTNAHFTKFGWCLFVVSAVLFGWSAVRARDWIAATGAGAFLIANISFMVAIYREDNRQHGRQ